jgi:hypothetical protein
MFVEVRKVVPIQTRTRYHDVEPEPVILVLPWFVSRQVEWLRGVCDGFQETLNQKKFIDVHDVDA